MVRFLVRMGLVVLVSLALCPASEASVVSKMSALGTKMQQAVKRSKAAIGTAALVIAVCANMMSCEYQRELTDDVVLTASPEVVGSLPIMQGATTVDETQIFVLTDKDKQYRFALVDGKGRETEPAMAEARGYLDSAQVMQRVLFQGLTADTPYLLQVRAADHELLDERELHTLSAAREDLCFAFGSCMWDALPQGDIWEQMVSLDPDIIFLIGDNVYADFPTVATSPAGLWQRYVETRQTLGIFRNKRLIPISATWDDHDYGLNNSNREYEFKDDVQEIFEIFFVSDASANYHTPGYGVASLVEIYGYSFFLMDNRSYRSPLGVSPERQFGEGQMQWLLDNLQGREHAFIASGDQFFGGYSHIKDDPSILADESFEGDHPARFAYFLEQLQELDTRVVFLSGDRHYAEIMAIPADVLGYRTYEFSSSPVGTIPLSASDVPNPQRVFMDDSARNFMLVKVKENGDALVMQTAAHSEGGKVLFKGTYEVE